jgi:hypothetical protein
MNVIDEAASRLTRKGVGGRPYIGPKAQTPMEETLWEKTHLEASRRGIAHSEVIREVLYSGMLATGRATGPEVSHACDACGIDYNALAQKLGK